MTTFGPFAFATATTGGSDDFLYTNTQGGPSQNAATLPATSGNLQWWWDDNQPGSTGIGPTSGQGGSPEGYIRTETSNTGTGFNDTYDMEFDTTLDASAESYELTFYTNMRGTDNGMLCEVQINESAGGWVTVTGGTFGGPGESLPPKVITSGTDIWELRTVDLSDSGANNDSSTRVRFLLTMPASGTTWHNDYGLDTITFTGTVLGGTYDQDSFRGRNDDGTNETDATWKAAVNINWNQPTDENFRVRFLVEETADVADADMTFQLQYNKNSGGWNDVDAASTNVRSSASTKLTDGENTTEQLNGPGTFLTTNAGVDEVNGLAGGTSLDFTATVNQEVELEYCAQVRSADTIPGDTIELRLFNAKSSAVLATYTNTPTMTVPASEYTQTSFRGRNDDGIDETDATWIATIDTDFSQDMDTNFRIRFLIEETADLADSNVEFQLQYNLESAGWNNVDAASSVIRSFASTKLTDGQDTTEQLNGPGTFLTPNDGVDEVNGIAGGADMDFTATVNQEVELEYCIQIRTADVAAFETVQLRVLVSTGTGTVNTYTNIPTITATTPPHWVMVASSQFVDGDVTTRQLTDLGGGFIAGEIKEDDGIVSLITLPAGEFTEHEFCMQATTGAASATQYEFRLVDDDQSGEKLETYDQIAKVTLT